jgi:hypothetical protein
MTRQGALQRVTAHHVYQVTQDIRPELFDALDSSGCLRLPRRAFGRWLLMPIIRVCPELIRSVRPGQGDKLCSMPSCDRRQIRNVRPIREYRPGEPDVTCLLGGSSASARRRRFAAPEHVLSQRRIHPCLRNSEGCLFDRIVSRRLIGPCQ